MGKPETYEIVFDQPQAVYQAGQTVRGHVALCLRHPLKMRSISILLIGRGRVHWKDNTGRSGRVVYFRSEEEYFHKKIILFGSGSEEEMVHPTGFHSYPFELDLPRGLPSSFEGAFGFVRYSAKANIDLRLRRDYDIKAAFTVLSHLDLNKEPSALKVPVEGRNQSEVNCCWTASGEVSAEFGLDRRGFVPGEMINIRGQVHNNSNTIVKRSIVSLKQYVEFYGVPDTMFSSKEPKCYRMESCLATTERGTVEPGKTDVWNDVLLAIPPAPPSRLNGCSIININYAVEFNVVAKYGSKLMFLADIVIGTIPFYDLYALSSGTEVISRQPSSTTSPKTADGSYLEPSEHLPYVDSEADVATSSEDVAMELPTMEFKESRQGLVNIREEGDSRSTKGRLLWAPVYITYTISALMRQQKLLQQQQQQQQQPRRMIEETPLRQAENQDVAEETAPYSGRRQLDDLRKDNKNSVVKAEEVEEAKEEKKEEKEEEELKPEEYQLEAEELKNGIVIKIETISI